MRMTSDMIIGQLDADVAVSPFARLLSISNDDLSPKFIHRFNIHGEDEHKRSKEQNECNRVVRGLKNTNGNICYFNSIIQMLSSSEHFISYLQNLKKLSKQNSPLTDFSENLYELINYVNGSSGGASTGSYSKINSLSTTVLMEIFPKSYNVFQQQDAQEFLMLIMEKLDQYSLENPLIGWSMTSLKCCECNTVKPIQNQIFGTLALSTLFGCSSLEQMLDQYISRSAIEGVECYNCTLQQTKNNLQSDLLCYKQALEYVRNRHQDISESEHLSEQAKMVSKDLNYFSKLSPDDDNFEIKFKRKNFDFHDSCGSDGAILHRKFFKKEFISRPPLVLVLHIHRRTATAKIRKKVGFPVLLNLSTYIVNSGHHLFWISNGEISSGEYPRSSPVNYTLRSVVEHQGSNNCGHYLTYRKFGDFKSEKWVCTSDEFIKVVDWEIVAKAEAYLLLYERIC